MAMKSILIKTRLRSKGQVTLPAEVREHLEVSEGDDLVFSVNDKGQIIVDRAKIIPPNQAWFWTERWQKMEKAAQADIEAGRISHIASLDEAIAHFEEIADASDQNH